MATRAPLATLFALDTRLAGIVGQAREAMLAQIKFAWWRERLAEVADDRPAGEPLLSAIGSTWAEHEEALSALVDRWEQMLGDDEPMEGSITIFAEARGAALAELAGMIGAEAEAEAASVAGRRWALAEVAHGAGSVVARTMGRALPPPVSISRNLRGVAVLDGLAARSLVRGEPMLAGRGAVLAAMRLGMFGR
ncbi:hypothetical protein [Tsuneonella amylolytica]|uniref:hypothetical protein n=1 Tax=Tsuneonella amylolytica TaxID=2338327 RepID=UPI000EA948B3|nr:hypothetical protein [Tsuneonella amylolytica]